MTSVRELFPLRHAPLPEPIARPQLRRLLAVLRDLMVRLARARTRAEVLGDAMHAAARNACCRVRAGLDPGLIDAPCGANLAGPVDPDAAAMEAFAGGLARAAIRLGRRRLRGRRTIRRVRG